MRRLACLSGILVLSVLLGRDIGAKPAGKTNENPTIQDDKDRVEKNKQTFLSRVKRDKVTFRGDKPGEIRIRWEWFDKVVNRYIFERDQLISELSAGEKFQLRSRWVYKDMKVTFQELFQLGPEDDDKLLPILSYRTLLDMTPSASLQGLALLGKHGEVKGTVVRKLMVRSYYLYLGTYFLFPQLEIKEPGGKISRAILVWGNDAYTVRWKDVKNLVVDDMSEEKALEDMELERDAIYPEQPGS